MKKIIPLFIVFAIVFSAFYIIRNKKDDPNAYFNLKDMLIKPFDTAKVLAMMNIVDSMNEVSNYLYELDKSLYPKIDTLDLIDMRWACDCPNWRYADSTNENFSWSKDFYLEPANSGLVLPEYFRLGRIQFIGREYGGNGYPKNPQFMDPNPTKGRVFKYYAYKIYKPYTVWGPIVKEKIFEESSASELKVK